MWWDGASKSSPLVYVVCRRHSVVQHYKRPCRKEAWGMEKSHVRARIEDLSKEVWIRGVQWTSICRDSVTGRDIKESEDIHTPRIDVGGGLITGCGSHPLSAERVEELEESAWSVVRQENEREDQGEGVQNSGKTSTGVRSRDMGIEEGAGK